MSAEGIEMRVGPDFDKGKLDDEVLEEELDEEFQEPKTPFDKFWYSVTQMGAMVGFDVPDIRSLEVDNMVVDSTDLPKHWTFNSFVFYQLCFWALAAYFFATNYILCRTSTFISLDSGSGVCKGEKGSDKCCEVPTSITATFLADSFGRWDTYSNFNYNYNNYVLQMIGVQYTNEEYAVIMRKINREVKAIGYRGASRDYAWNMVAWSSFTSINKDSGSFKFYMSGEAGAIFSKTVIAAGFASNASDTSPCTVAISTSVDALAHAMEVDVDLGCTSAPCQDNPCPNILGPQAMGYDTQAASTTTMSFKIDLASVNVALAVNMGILPIDNLVNYSGDNARVTLLNAMVSAGSISQMTAYNTSSYYEPLYAPMEPVYCQKYQEYNTSSCYVRIGNTLVYPVINHYGWSSDGFSRPSRCTKSAATVTGSAAYFYCNKMDLVTGLIYYPVGNVNITEKIKQSTWTPTRSPSQNPTPLPGKPTVMPTTTRPSARPTTTKPSHTPTRRPSRTPTKTPTLAPTAPTIAPSSIAPTYRRTRRPTTARRLLKQEEKAEDLVQEMSLLEDVQEEVQEIHLLVNVPTSSPSLVPVTDAPTVAPVDDDYFNTPQVYTDDNFGGFYSSSSFSVPTDDFSSSGSAAGSASGSDSGSANVDSTPEDSADINYYAAGKGDDTFVPLVAPIVDNGKIFALGKYAAKILAQSLQNDDYTQKASYDAMISTILGSSTKSYRADFRKLCNGNHSISTGCALFAWEVYGGDNRVVNDYLYQPSTTPAYSNTLFNSKTMAVITKKPPTSLVETYYSCVLTIWDSIFQAIGLANSSVQFFVTVGFFLYFYATFAYLTRVKGKEIELLHKKRKRLALEALRREKKLDEVAEVFEVMKTRFDALCDDVKRGDKNLSTFERAILYTEIKDLDANNNHNNATNNNSNPTSNDNNNAPAYTALSTTEAEDAKV